MTTIISTFFVCDAAIGILLLSLWAAICDLFRWQFPKYPAGLQIAAMILFPWLVFTGIFTFIALRWYKAYRRSFTIFSLCIILVGIYGIVQSFIQQQILAAFFWIELLYIREAILYMVKKANDKNDDDEDDGGTEPDGPTPTGDAVELWLNKLILQRR